MKRAVLYLRSSKDQKDVSIQTQRLDLTALAERRSIKIVGEYSDVVESAKDWDRPGFQQLLHGIRKPNRGWDLVLTLDTARIARRRNLALIFEEQECAVHGVDVCYANIPDGGDPATTMILRTLLQAMDEWHSITSRNKGLAGMAENVRQGYRAGGKAPHGYRLHRNNVGIIRHGEAVTKSTLEPVPDDAAAVKIFLELRAADVPRAQAAQAAELKLKASSLVGLEWNALIYAGCTTFGVYHERTSSGGYKTKRKRRPRSEWLINEGTHPALISRAQAERILRALETSDHAAATSRGRASVSPYALSGMIETPAGIVWEVNKRVHYNAPRADGRRRYLPIELVDRAVIDQVISAICSDALAKALLEQTRQQSPDHAAEIKRLQKEIAALAVKIDRAAGLALELEDPAPYQRKIEALERERRQLVARQADLHEEQRLADAVGAISLQEIREVLDDLAENLRRAQPQMLKLALRGIVRRVTLDPDSLSGSIEYQVPVAAEKHPAGLALLRRRHAYGVLSARAPLQIAYVDGRASRWKNRA